MDDEFISDEEVEAYEKKSNPARRAVVWSLAAVVAAFVLVGGAYLFGMLGGSAGELTASLFGNQSEEGEVFALRSSGDAGNHIVAPAKRDAGSAACGYDPVQNRSATVAQGQPVSNGAGSRVLMSEVAWMGTEEGAQYEWIEIANTGSMPVNIGGWSLVDKDEQIQFVFPKSASIPAGGFMLLARNADRVGNVKADYRYGGNLKNEDEGVRLFNAGCEVIDEARAVPKWPAGESVERRTMERNFATKDWYASSKIGGTPRAQNSTPPAADPGWSDILDYPATSTALTSTAADRLDTSDRSDMSNRSDAGQGVVMISEVMAGKDGAANWDFVELHNAGSGAVNLTGWSVKKKSSTGSESALVTASRFEGKTIPAGRYILLAHPDYAGAPLADVVWPKSYTLAYVNNAVVIYNANGEKVSEVSWTEIPKGQSYAENSPAGGGTWVTGVPTPRMAP